MPARDLTADALRIWRAGVEAVAPERLLTAAIRAEGDRLCVETTRGDAVDAPVSGIRRLIVVGGGKAGAGMARGLEASLAGTSLADRMEGLLSVPADCVAEGSADAIELVAGRPAGVNEPRTEGVAATRRMLDLVRGAGPDDLVVCLLSGGGSALLPAPSAPITLDEKIAATRLLSASGATIEQLNTVRQQISDAKGGGLARACRAGRLWTLVLSDVLGDPLDLIASGPTVTPRSTPRDAIAVLEELGVIDEVAAQPIVAYLRDKPHPEARRDAAEATTLVLANNATAVDAAGMEAERLGYNHAMDCATSSEGAAEDVGRHLAAMAARMLDANDTREPDCLITGGEPTVTLAPAEERGRGGRNQQLVLAALRELRDCRGVALLSGGTDGEDGPTDAAGAWIDERVAASADTAAIEDALRRNDAYAFFEPRGSLLKTGPTHTNVCDLRVVTVERRA